MKTFKTLNIDYLTLIIFLEITALFFIHYELNDKYLIQVNSSLMTATGIFSAILISYILSRTDRLIEKKEELNKVIINDSIKLTNFRRFLYYILKFDSVWGHDYQYLSKLHNSYPAININTKYQNDFGDDQLNNLVNDKRFEDRKTRLFLSMVTIVDLDKREELSFIQPIVRYLYDVKTLENYRYNSNLVWYYLMHKPASNINFNPNSINPILKENFLDIANRLFKKNYKVSDFNKYKLADAGGYFSEEFIPELLEKVNKITRPISKNLIILIVDLFILLISGLVYPIIIISTSLIGNSVNTKISLIVCIAVILHFLFCFIKYLLNDTKIYNQSATNTCYT